MKNQIQNKFLIAFSLINNVIFAQGPDPDNLPNDLNPTDAPVNQYLILVTMASIVFVYCILSKKSRAIKH
jgi:hypothetical protein